MPLNAKLVVVGGDVKTTEIKLRLPSTVGRGRGTTIMLPHPLVSRQHCELFENNGQLMVRDLGSLNGTFVNNQRITESPLPPGELLTIGTVTFRAMYEAQPDSQPPTGAGPQMKPRRSETDVAGLPPGAIPAAPQDGPIAFEEAVVPVEESAAPAAGPLHVTKRMETTLEDRSGVPKTESVASAKTKPAPAKAATPAPAKDTAKPAAKGDVAVDFSKLADDPAEDEPANDEDDGDLGDFLKSLKK